jgi:hypothetical protein
VRAKSTRASKLIRSTWASNAWILRRPRDGSLRSVAVAGLLSKRSSRRIRSNRRPVSYSLTGMSELISDALSLPHDDRSCGHEGRPGAWMVGGLQRTTARDLAIQQLHATYNLRWTVVMAWNREEMIRGSHSEHQTRTATWTLCSEHRELYVSRIFARCAAVITSGLQAACLFPSDCLAKTSLYCVCHALRSTSRHDRHCSDPPIR